MYTISVLLKNTTTKQQPLNRCEYSLPCTATALLSGHPVIRYHAGSTETCCKLSLHPSSANGTNHTLADVLPHTTSVIVWACELSCTVSVSLMMDCHWFAFDAQCCLVSKEPIRPVVKVPPLFEYHASEALTTAPCTKV